MEVPFILAEYIFNKLIAGPAHNIIVLAAFSKMNLGAIVCLRFARNIIAVANVVLHLARRFRR